MYHIVHPVPKCNTEIGGVRFIDGLAHTDLTGVLLSFAATPEEAAEKFRAMGFKVTEGKSKTPEGKSKASDVPGTPDESAGAG